VHLASLEPGAVRGNHRHPNVTEWLLVFGAPATVAWRAPDGAEEQVGAGAEGPVLVELPPGTPHALRGEGPGTAYLLSWADGEPETEKVAPLL